MKERKTEEIVSRWDNLGLLQGQTPEQKTSCALSMESMAEKMLISVNDDLMPWKHIIFPIVARIFNGNAFAVLPESENPCYNKVIEADTFLEYIKTTAMSSLFDIDNNPEFLKVACLESLCEKYNLPGTTTIDEFFNFVFVKHHDEIFHKNNNESESTEMRRVFVNIYGNEIDFEAHFCAIVSCGFGNYLIEKK